VRGEYRDSSREVKRNGEEQGYRIEIGKDI
jgi:hypothetical protein